MNTFCLADELVEELILNDSWLFNSTKVWQCASHSVKDVIECLLDPNPTTRMTAEEFLHHPWVRDIGPAITNPLPAKVLLRYKQVQQVCSVLYVTVLCCACHRVCILYYD